MEKVINQFIEKWKKQQTAFYFERYDMLKKVNEANPISAASSERVFVKDEKNEIRGGYKSYSDFYYQHGKTIMDVIADCSDSYIETRITNAVNKEAEKKKAIFISKIEKKVSHIFDAKFEIGIDGNINGTVWGIDDNDMETKYDVRTITAGGYYIQCLHYRVMINKIK